MFKILNTRTGLYSSGGYYPSWSQQGKLYRTLTQALAALALYCRGQPIQGRLEFRTAKARASEAERRKKRVPASWTIVEFELKPIRWLNVRTAMKRKP